MGFTHNVELLQNLGIDQIVSDRSLKLGTPFQTLQNHYPFVYHLRETKPKIFSAFYNKTLAEIENPNQPEISEWNETRISFHVVGPTDNSFVILQKTYLPGWKATINEYREKLLGPTFGVLSWIPLTKGKNQVELRFEPVSLRFGFFLFFLFFGAFSFSLFRRWVA